MRCGQPMMAVAPASPTPVVPVQLPRQKSAWPWVAAALLLLALLAFFAKFFNLFGIQASGVSPNLQVRASASSPNLQVSAQVPTSLKMPQDVIDWLEHLRKIEEKKNELSIKQEADMQVFQQMLSTLGPGIGQLDPYNQSDTPGGDDPDAVAKGKFEDLRPQWDALVEEFQSVPPPNECKPIADDYYAAINEIPGMISDLEDVLNQVSTDPQAALAKAEAMKSTSYTTIDENLHKTDDRVQAICDKYGVKKWFNIGDRGGVFSKAGF